LPQGPKAFDSRVNPA